VGGWLGDIPEIVASPLEFQVEPAITFPQLESEKSHFHLVSMAFEGGFVWVASNGGLIYKIDPQTMEVIKQYDWKVNIEGEELSVPISQLVSGGTRVWATSMDYQSIVALNILTDSLEETINFPLGVHGTVFDGKNIWVINQSETLQSYDPENGLRETLPVTRLMDELSFDGKWLWVRNILDHVYYAIDPIERKVLHQVDLTAGTGYTKGPVYIGNKLIWLTSWNVQQLNPDTWEISSVDMFELNQEFTLENYLSSLENYLSSLNLSNYEIISVRAQFENIPINIRSQFPEYDWDRGRNPKGYFDGARLWLLDKEKVIPILILN
jgi:hypothetical protein